MGPLAGVKVLEFAGIGPGPLASMLLADMGATVVRIDRVAETGLGVPVPPAVDFTRRSRATIGLDLKQPKAIEFVLKLVESSDALLEGFRPGVMERLGLGPDVCLKRNPKLAYGRMTGWGQTGPLALAAGHDMNYIALTGALHAIGRAGQKPTPPLNLVGDYGGGAMFLVTGLLAAIIHARSGGPGQVVDAAMVDGALSLMTPIYAMAAAGRMDSPRGNNQLDSGAYYYEVYECADGEYISIACIEEKFHADLMRLLELDPSPMPAQRDKAGWQAWKDKLQAIFKTRTRDHWCRLLEGSDACFAPVLSMQEAHAHPHNAARGAFVEVGGVLQPGPAPRFGTTKLATPRAPAEVNTAEALAAWGVSEGDMAAAGVK